MAQVAKLIKPVPVRYIRTLPAKHAFKASHLPAKTRKCLECPVEGSVDVSSVLQSPLPQLKHAKKWVSKSPINFLRIPDLLF